MAVRLTRPCPPSPRAAGAGARTTCAAGRHQPWREPAHRPEDPEANKLRTVLTALGVIIGVAAVVALLAIGRGTQEQIAERITANGANLLTVRARRARRAAATPR